MGQRVRNVMTELHGEKIDIVDWSEDPAEMIAHALSPAQVSSVEIVDEAARSARVVVPDYQLSLAIGKEGQNARLAARLTGWRIDIRSEPGALDDTVPVPPSTTARPPSPPHRGMRAAHRLRVRGAFSAPADRGQRRLVVFHVADSLSGRWRWRCALQSRRRHLGARRTDSPLRRMSFARHSG